MTNGYEDLRRAIESTAFVQRSEGAVIVGSEVTGKREEWLFDFRALMLQAKWLNRYAEIFWEQYADKLPFQVGAMETAGISLIAAIVMKGAERGTPINGFFIRKSRKRHGLMKQIEGTLTDEPIVLVDDLINSGSTLEKQMTILSDAGCSVTDVFVLLAFREPESYQRLSTRGASIRHIFTLEDFGIPLLQEKKIETNVQLQLVWRYTGPNPSYHLVVQKSAPVIDDSLVFLGCDDGTMRALDQKTGDVVWEFNVGKHSDGKGILSTPAIHNGVLYFGAYDGVVYALDSRTGKEKWRYDDADWIGSSPSLAPELGLLFIGLEFGLFRKQGGIVALDMLSGRMRWQHTTAAMTHGSPLYIKEESMVAIGSNDGISYAYDAITGALRWRNATQGDLKVAPAYAAKQRIVFFTSMDGKLYAFGARDGMPIYAYETGAALYSIPLVHNDTVYVASLDKTLYAIDIGSSKLRWQFLTRGRIFGSPVVVGPSVFIGSNDGCLYEVSAEHGTQVGYFQASERIMSKIAYNEASHCIFARTVANELYCLKRPA